jgi:ribokinase
MAPKIVVVGSANTDYIVRISHLPVEGETVIGGKFYTANGGKGANQAVAAARLGAAVTLIARLGTDATGDAAIEAYRREAINTDFIVRDTELPSGVAFILVGETGRNMIAVASGSNGALSPTDVMRAKNAIQNADCVLLQLEIPVEAVLATARLASQYGIRIILNPAPSRELASELLRLVDVLTPNEEEAGVLLPGFTRSGDRALPELARITGVKNIIITLGEKGSRVYSQGHVTEVPGFPVKAIDTTACGDAFNGALAVALGSRLDLLQAVRYANAAGAMAATRLGAQPSLPTAQEVEELMA